MKLLAKYLLVALSFVGSAISLFSCDQTSDDDASGGDEVRMNEYSENLSLVMSENGRRSYHFTAPLVEGYTLAQEPYREFRKGVKITTYLNDSLSSVDAVLTANYAIYYENRQLWEAKGNVVIVKSDGKTLYTQQLFWNARTKKIYSNVDSKIVQSGGRDVFIGEGFESDEAFQEWRFRRMKGRMEVDVTPTENADSVSVAGGVSKRPVSASSSGTSIAPATSATSAARIAPATPAISAATTPAASTTPAAPTTPSAAQSRALRSDRPQPPASAGSVEPLSLDPKQMVKQGINVSKETLL